MLKRIKQKRFLILASLLAFVLLAGTGYFFAKQKSKPVYRTKIEKIMFEKKNRSPKYVLTMPERSKVVKKAETVPEEHRTASQEDDSEPKTVEAIMRGIPFLMSLGEAPNQTPLRKINLDENITTLENGLNIPKIAGNGQRAWTVYSRPVSVQPNFYRVSVIIKNLGLNELETDLISKGLPSEVSFSFSPYSVQPEIQIKKARSQGHETYIDLLLSSKDFLKSDTGPMAMSIIASIDENIRRLKKSLAVNAPVGGMVMNPGQAEKENGERITKVLNAVKDMGLLLVDATGEDVINNLPTENLARQRADIIIDEDFSRQGIKAKLKEAEQIARNRGQVLIVSDPKPSAIIAINDWIKTFSPQLSYEEMRDQNITSIERPFALVPVSSTVVE